MGRIEARWPIALAILLAPSASARGDDGPVGWASVDGGTTGGAGGRTLAVSDAPSFVEAVQGEGPRVVLVSGTIRLEDSVRVSADTTILGQGDDATLLGGGLRMVRVENVIIRNLSIREAPDAIDIEGSRHIWVDHCDLSSCEDGLLDIKRGSDLVTVSWVHFHDHHKTCLLGHSDKDDIRRLDLGHLRTTYHHNVFDGTQTRHPRVRFAEPVHVYNNSFKGNQYGVASLMDAGTLVEGNVFEGVRSPTLIEYGDSPDPGRLVERNNLYLDSGPPQSRGEVKEPREFYEYRLDDPSGIAEAVAAGAGVGKIAP